MKHLQAACSLLIAIFIILSAVVFPTAERFRVSEHTGTPLDITETPSVSASCGVQKVNPSNSESIIFSDKKIDNCVTPIEPDDTSIASQDTFIEAETEPSTDSQKLTADDVLTITSDAVETTSAAFVSQNAADDNYTTKPRNQTTIPTLDTFIPMTFGEDYSAILTSVDERHIYTFRVNERGYLRYSVSHAEQHGFMGWEATLYREYYLNGVNGEIGYKALNLLKTTALNPTDLSPTVGLMPGEYRIVIKTTSGISAEEYKLNAVFTAATDHEIECNDTKAAYTELYPEIPMIGSASNYADHQDDDWYLLRVKKDGKAQLTFKHEKSDSISVAWRIVLYDENGIEIYSENSGLNTEVLDSGEIGLRAGVYYIAVLCRTRCEYDYTLSVITGADDRFEQENNDSPETATPLALGGMISGCVTSKAGKLDRDYYRFEMPARGNFSLVFTHAPAALKDDKNGWRIRLLTESGEIMYSMISTWNASSDRMPVLGLEEGVYFIEVCSEDMYRSTLTYTVVAGSNESTGFEMEPNNTPAMANPIAQGVPVTGTIINAVDPDDDYYSFTVSAYSRVTVALKHEVITGNRDIFSFSVVDGEGVKAPLYTGRELLKDADGNNVYYVKSLADQENAVGYFELAPGNYYIKVTSGRFFDSINYSIEFYIN